MNEVDELGRSEHYDSSNIKLEEFRKEDPVILYQVNGTWGKAKEVCDSKCEDCSLFDPDKCK